MPKKISMPAYKATPRQSESKAIITFEAIASTGYAAVWLGLRADRVDGDEDAEEGGAPDERDAVYVLSTHRNTPSRRTRSGRAVTMAYCYHTFARESTR